MLIFYSFLFHCLNINMQITDRLICAYFLSENQGGDATPLSFSEDCANAFAKQHSLIHGRRLWWLAVPGHRGGYNLRVTDSSVNTPADTSALAYQCLKPHTYTHIQRGVTLIHVVKLRYVHSKHRGL